jgi:hypothetical protein
MHLREHLVAFVDASIKGDSNEDMSERTDAKKGADKNAAVMAEVVNKMAATNVSMVEAIQDRNTIAEKDADLRKYLQFNDILKDPNLSEERRDRLEVFCINYESNMAI